MGEHITYAGIGFGDAWALAVLGLGLLPGKPTRHVTFCNIYKEEAVDIWIDNAWRCAAS